MGILSPSSKDMWGVSRDARLLRKAMRAAHTNNRSDDVVDCKAKKKGSRRMYRLRADYAELAIL
jgi:hypothetical protein